MIPKEDKEKLDILVAAENSLIHKMFSTWSTVREQQEVLRYALAHVSSRRAALRLLVSLSDETKKSVFTELVDLSTVGHSDIALCRVVIKSLPRAWLLENIDSVVKEVLDRSEDGESYRRLAELLHEIDDGLLQSLLSRARQNSDREILEVAKDFERQSNN